MTRALAWGCCVRAPCRVFCVWCAEASDWNGECLDKLGNGECLGKPGNGECLGKLGNGECLGKLGLLGVICQPPGPKHGPKMQLCTPR